MLGYFGITGDIEEYTCWAGYFIEYLIEGGQGRGSGWLLGNAAGIFLAEA